MWISSATFDLSDYCFLELRGLLGVDHGPTLAQGLHFLLQYRDLIFEAICNFCECDRRVLLGLDLVDQAVHLLLSPLCIFLHFLLGQLVRQGFFLGNDINVIHLELRLGSSRSSGTCLCLYSSCCWPG